MYEMIVFDLIYYFTCSKIEQSKHEISIESKVKKNRHIRMKNVHNIMSQQRTTISQDVQI